MDHAVITYRSGVPEERMVGRPIAMTKVTFRRNVWGGLVCSNSGMGGYQRTAGAKKIPIISDRDSMNMAATYSPALWCSTIGHGGLNFSVRYGKR